ncbi:HlyD family efflux transporter periplasmic adaptor subunit [Dyadobacter sp. LHD-138]|uniref:HlyD family secretion protein n=1 Tax=Dyadobacter sp. LHD-138 TaxID=3071413 RepID=UPI0027E0F5A5|nr:HlyD family efflux transporter periplasmic adaptor subunit [Dyadobacter sp. LHD-138]MDQ6479323.1 HlyD family efflux transporter periplasmic adaptor subunit [Dyadobacter sp. LHD-138]
MKIRNHLITRHKTLPALALLFLLAACETKNDYDASGNFEADEVIVSAQQTGQLLAFSVQEGAELKEGEKVGQIDVKIPELQKQQTEASIAALKQKTGSSKDQTEVALKQLAVQESQLAQQMRERKRTENLVKADAATQKQLDDMDAAIDQMQKQIGVTRQQIKLYNYNAATQNRGILSEQSPLSVAAKQYQEQINRGQIINPLTGLVLTRYALKGEMTATGKPLYKIANMDTLTLKAYITGDKLAQIKTGQKVTVRIDAGEKKYKSYSGQIYWISAKAEFTPKTIQTKNERANLVYAMKVRVRNDGFLKIGMYGEVVLF